MKFSYNLLQSFFQNKLPAPKELANFLTMKVFEVNEVRKIGNDWLIDVDILPNRISDCCGHFGLAREIGTILNLKIKEPMAKLKFKNKENVLKKSKFSLCFRITGL